MTRVSFDRTLAPDRSQATGRPAPLTAEQLPAKVATLVRSLDTGAAVDAFLYKAQNPDLRGKYPGWFKGVTLIGRPKQLESERVALRIHSVKERDLPTRQDPNVFWVLLGSTQGHFKSGDELSFKGVLRAGTEYAFTQGKESSYVAVPVNAEGHIIGGPSDVTKTHPRYSNREL